MFLTDVLPPIYIYTVVTFSCYFQRLFIYTLAFTRTDKLKRERGCMHDGILC